MLKTLVVLAASMLCALPSNTPDQYPVGRIQTDKGEILFYLYPQTPNHQASFITLAKSQYFDSLTFNRVIKNFVAQGGCPDTPEGFAGSPYNLAPEFNDSLRHIYGAVGAGRDDNPQKHSAGCQLYIDANKNGLPRLDGNYTVYGQVIKGMDVVEAIVSVPTDSTDAPLAPIKLHVDIIEMSPAQLDSFGIHIR
jgi:peptidyl-prolyl cis-trans isomerase B (cyclophilin B)